MAVKSNFTFPSRDGFNTCYAYSWAPDDGKIRGIIQIVHGMQEHVARYDDFATFLAGKGFLVVGADHIGHGKSVSSDTDLGYMTWDHADIILVRNVHRLKKIVQEQNPGVPIFILGHSMGSLIFRRYITMYGKGIDGALIMSTADKSTVITRLGIIVSTLKSKFISGYSTSKFLDHSSFGRNNAHIESPRTSYDWLTHDEKIVDEYIADPLCGFPFKVNGYRALMQLLNYICKKKNLTTIPKELPILIVAGTEDPVGDYGKGPTKVYERFKSLNIKDVTLKLYENMRHELLNEIGRKDVYDYILNWIESHMEKK